MTEREGRRRSGILSWARLETPWLTAAYWGAVGLFVLAFWLPEFPPLVDYPQHLAMASVLRRWFAGGAFERETFELNLLTYNGGFHVLTALLGFVVPMEIAGRIMLSAIPVLLASGALALMRAAQRPRFYAFFLLAVTFNTVVTWGFINNALAFALGIPTFAWFYRALDGEKRFRVAAACGGALLSWIHLLGAFVLSAAAGLVALRRLLLGDEPLARRSRTFLMACLTLSPQAILSVFFFVRNRTSHYANSENAMHDGVDDFAWRKVLHYANWHMGVFADFSDRVLFFALVGLALYAAWPRRMRTAGHGDFRFLSFLFLLVYLLTPRTLFATWLIFERIPLVWEHWLVAAMPVSRVTTRSGFKAALALLTVGTALNVDAHVARIPEEKDASAVLDAMPDGRRVMGLVWEPKGLPLIQKPMWLHFQSYYQVRHGGETSPSFTVVESLPIHYKPERRPPRRGSTVEWEPGSYSVTMDDARYFDTVLVVAPRELRDAEVASFVFKEAAPRVKVMAHRGRFWAFDVAPALDGSPVSQRP